MTYWPEERENLTGRKVQYFTEKEDELTRILIGIGVPRTVSKVLVFLGNTPEATSRDIERGADLRQPEVSIAMQYLREQGWITSRLERSDSIGRPQNVVRLSQPIAGIIEQIRTEKEDTIRRKMALAHKLRDYLT
ncbi:MAG: MarR family transcriptional regulator [Methanoregula sp.]|uniref:MarR family transcriptional regulator n=1 Tax=Methanoregula sp. TaxID=2052170 RepID=UPI003C77855C